jgi:hypothetical protein
MVMIAVAWLVLWCVMDRSKMNWWWPFDYRETNEDETKKTDPRAPPTPPWRRRS